MRARFRAAVVGLGRIGQEYDYEAPDASAVLTHASGFSHHPGFELVAGVDPERSRRERFERRFGKPAYADIEETVSRHRLDVWSIGVPTELHHTVLDEILQYEPVAVVCEKPIASAMADARRMISAAAAAGCALQVNYMRRFEPGVLKLRRLITAGHCGEIRKGVVWYNRGLLNGGSHFIDLLRFLLGEVTDVRVIAAGLPGGSSDDSEPDVMIDFQRTAACFLAAPVSEVSIGDVVLIGTRGMVRYSHGGKVIEIVPAEPDALCPGQTVLGHPLLISNDIQRYQWHVLEALYRHLVDGIPLNSDGASAAATLDVVGRVRQQIAGAAYV